MPEAVASPPEEWPKEFQISKKVSAKVGFKDGHVEIGVRVGFPIGTVSLRIDATEVGEVDKVIEAAKAWLGKSEVFRRMKGVE